MARNFGTLSQIQDIESIERIKKRIHSFIQEVEQRIEGRKKYILELKGPGLYIYVVVNAKANKTTKEATERIHTWRCNQNKVDNSVECDNTYQVKMFHLRWASGLIGACLP